MDETTKHYTNGVVTVVWKPALCAHSEKCRKGLPAVFDPQKKPWINMEAAATERIIQQVMECPSGALSFVMNTKDEQAE